MLPLKSHHRSDVKNTPKMPYAKKPQPNLYRYQTTGTHADIVVGVQQHTPGTMRHVTDPMYYTQLHNNVLLNMTASSCVNIIFLREVKRAISKKKIIKVAQKDLVAIKSGPLKVKFQRRKQ